MPYRKKLLAIAINALALIVGLDVLINILGQDRTDRLGFRVGGPDAPGNEGGQNQGQNYGFGLVHGSLLVGMAPGAPD